MEVELFAEQEIGGEGGNGVLSRSPSTSSSPSKSSLSPSTTSLSPSTTSLLPLRPLSPSMSSSPSASSLSPWACASVAHSPYRSSRSRCCPYRPRHLRPRPPPPRSRPKGGFCALPRCWPLPSLQQAGRSSYALAVDCPELTGGFLCRENR